MQVIELWCHARRDLDIVCMWVVIIHVSHIGIEPGPRQVDEILLKYLTVEFALF